MPGIAYTLSCFYRRRELLLRVGIFVLGASLSGAIGGLLATGLSSIPPAGRLHTWRWIFLIEGIITVLVSTFSFYYVSLTAFFVIPCSSFLNAEERELAAARIEEELKHIKNEPVDWKQIKRALTTKFNIMCGIGLFFDNMIVQSFSLFLPTILNDMGFIAIKAQLLTVPVSPSNDHATGSHTFLHAPLQLQLHTCRIERNVVVSGSSFHSRSLLSNSRSSLAPPTQPQNTLPSFSQPWELSPPDLAFWHG